MQFGNRVQYPSNNYSGLWVIEIMDHSAKKDQTQLEKSLSMLKADALNFAIRFIHDPKIRTQYMLNIRKLSDEYSRRIKMGTLPPKTAADEVNLLRNQILIADRLRLSEVGVAYSEKLKQTGKTLPDRMEYYSNKIFKLPFNELNVTQQNQVYLEIVQGGGRAYKTTNILARRLSILGRGLLFVTIAISVYNIATSDDTLRETAKEGTTLGIGILGGSAGGAIAGLACGPGAPICITLGVFIGGALGAMGAGYAFGWFY
jgi:hypothetical protein